jgi:hypothetical protein
MSACAAKNPASTPVNARLYPIGAILIAENYVEYMIEQHTRAALEQQQWTIVVNKVSPLPHKASLIIL